MSRRTLTLFSLLLLFAVNFRARAEWLEMQRLAAGVSEMIGLDLAEDRDGIVWIAAPDGLYRHLGDEAWQKLAPADGYPFDSARHLELTSGGDMWIGSAQGLVRHSGGSFRIMRADPVRAMVSAGDGLFAAFADGIFRFQGGESIKFASEVPNGPISRDRDDTLWFGCGTGICALSPQTRMVTRRQVPSGNRPTWLAVARDSDGTLWLSSGHEIVAYHRERIAARILRRTPGIWRPVANNRSGDVWILDGDRAWRAGNQTASLCTFKTETNAFRPIDSQRLVAATPNGVSDCRDYPGVRFWRGRGIFGGDGMVALAGHGGRVFLATRNGIFKTSVNPPHTWTRIPVPKHLKDLRSLYAEEDSLWVIDRASGLVRLALDGTERARLPPEGLPNAEFFRQVIRDRRGRVWLGSKQGLFQITQSPQGLAAAKFPMANRSAYAAQMALDSNDRLWTAHEGGIAALDGDTWRDAGVTQALLVPFIRAATLPAADTLFIGYRRTLGLTVLRRSASGWSRDQLMRSGGFLSDDVHFVRRDSRGRVWWGGVEGFAVTTAQGLRPDEWHVFGEGAFEFAENTEEQGFWEDPSGNVWVATRAGVFRIDTDWAPWPAPAPVVADARVEGRELQLDLRHPVAGVWRRQPIQYRLASGPSNWQSTGGSRLTIKPGAGGDYAIEARFAGPSLANQTVTYRFQIGQRITETLAFRTATLTATAAGVLWLWLTGRLRLGWLFFTYWVRKFWFRFRRRREAPSPALSPQWPAEGSLLRDGRYRLGPILGAGGFSRVHRTFDAANPGRELAAKVIPLRQDRILWQKNRFAHEIAAMRSLNVAGVMPVLDSWIEPDGPAVIVMPLMPGPTLQEWAAGLPPPGPQRTAAVLPVIAGLATTIGEVHAAGFVHRDLKPGNILMVDRDGGTTHPLLADFGSAAARTCNANVDITLDPAGSFGYMAPEQLRGQYHTSTDLYSFSLIVFELVSGIRWMDAGFHWKSCLRRWLPDPTANLLEHALQPEPSARPQDSALWIDGLLRSLDGSTD